MLDAARREFRAYNIARSNELEERLRGNVFGARWGSNGRAALNHHVTKQERRSMAVGHQ
jgi:hypothetical protein